MQLSFFHKAGPLLFCDSLRDVVQCYVLFRPDVGYMQGMSHLAAMLLLYNGVCVVFRLSFCVCVWGGEGGGASTQYSFAFHL